MTLQELMAATLIALLRHRSLSALTKQQIMAGHQIATELFHEEAIRKEAGGEPISEVLISKLHHLESTSSYQEIVSWTVPSGKRGRLYQIQFAADDYAHILWRYTMDGKVQWKDKYLPTATTENWYGATVRAEKQIKIEGKDDGTIGTIWGAITGTEET